ncbi:tryptophan/tyrosine permease family protein, partial [Vibrio parahaemolyticus V-223/04]|jgi:hypothetical protein
LHH